MASGGVADRERGDGSPQRVIRGEDAVVAMPVPSWWGHEIGKPVQELARREIDDALLRRRGGLALSAGADPCAALVA